ncbi:MAG: DoxX family membrane protein, partial [Propionibacteriaceae bacterium]|nr:DoxX family membrane protein [Propionibacteriaceae bacterium]
NRSANLEGQGDNAPLMPPPLPVVDLTDPAVATPQPAVEATLAADDREKAQLTSERWAPLPPMSPGEPSDATAPPVAVPVTVSTTDTPGDPAHASATSPGDAVPVRVPPKPPAVAPIIRPADTPTPVASPAASNSPAEVPAAAAPEAVATPEAPAAAAPTTTTITSPSATGADAPTQVMDMPVNGDAAATDPGQTTSASVATPAPAAADQSGVIAPSPSPDADQATEEQNQATARMARSKALGEVKPMPDVVAAPVRFLPPTTYNKFPSLVMIILRALVIVLLVDRVWLDLRSLSDTITLWENTVLPQAYAEYAAYAQIGLEMVIAILLLFGLGTRVAGALLIVINAAWLMFLLWGVGSPWSAAGSGVAFAGELQVLWIAVGFVFLGLGGGGWLSLDAYFHRARIERKNEKAS